MRSIEYARKRGRQARERIGGPAADDEELLMALAHELGHLELQAGAPAQTLPHDNRRGVSRIISGIAELSTEPGTVLRLPIGNPHWRLMQFPLVGEAP
jgi:hypothetical protein